MALIEKLCESPVAVNSSEQIQNIVMFLQRSEGLSRHVDSFMQMLSLLQLKDDSLFVLSPLLSDELREANFLRYYYYCSSCISDDSPYTCLFLFPCYDKMQPLLNRFCLLLQECGFVP